MSLKYFISLFQNKKDNIVEDDNLVLLKELPFYGIGGTIYRIEEAPECYYKVLYNQDGSINSLKIPVPKKKTKNLSLIIDDYINEIKKYLEVSYDKYIDCSDKEIKRVLNNKEFYMLFVITLLACLASIPFLFTTIWVGLLFSTISTLALYIVCDIHKKDKEKEKEYIIFKSQYKELQKVLDDYNVGKSIIKDNSKEVFSNKSTRLESNVNILGKINMLINEKNREIA